MVPRPNRYLNRWERSKAGRAPAVPGERGPAPMSAGYAAGMARRFDFIRTARLVMRRWRDADREPYAAMNADPEVMRYFPAPLDRAASDASVDRIEEFFDAQGFGLWAVEVASTGEFIGFTGLNPMPGGVPGAGGIEVGWRLARRAWHHGYATEAAVAAVDVGLGGAGLDQIWSMTAVLNQPSQSVMRRLGMTLDTHFDHPRIPAGHPLRPHVAYRLRRPEWTRTKSAPAAQHGEQDQHDGDPGEYAVTDHDGEREMPLGRG